MLYAIMLSVIMLNVVMLNDILLSSIMLNVASPFKTLLAFYLKHSSFWPSADVKPMSNYLCILCPGSACLLYVCLYYDLRVLMA